MQLLDNLRIHYSALHDLVLYMLLQTETLLCPLQVWGPWCSEKQCQDKGLLHHDCADRAGLFGHGNHRQRSEYFFWVRLSDPLNVWPLYTVFVNKHPNRQIGLRISPYKQYLHKTCITPFSEGETGTEKNNLLINVFLLVHFAINPCSSMLCTMVSQKEAGPKVVVAVWVAQTVSMVPDAVPHLWAVRILRSCVHSLCVTLLSTPLVGKEALQPGLHVPTHL